MSKLFLLLLCFVGLHAIVVLPPLPSPRTFKDARLTIQITQETSNCWYAGTDCDVTISVGFLDQHSRLRYFIRTPAQKGNEWNFERANKIQFKYEVPQADVMAAEQACANLATTHFGFDTSTYENCFRVNLVHFDTYTWWGNVYSSWKPSYTHASLMFTLPDGSRKYFHATLSMSQNCKAEWVTGGGSHYMCREDNHQYRPFLPNKWLQVSHETANCYRAGTDCDVTISLGFLDQDSKLRYAIRTAAQKGSAWNVFERGTELRFEYEVPQEDVMIAEQACANLATTTFGFDTPTYENCFEVNFIHFDAYTWWGNAFPNWKPQYTFTTLTFTLPDGSKKFTWTTFKMSRNCAAEWVVGGGSHYMCSEDQHWYRNLLPIKRLEVGETYTCQK
uniref:C-type lectin domain-containing protein n=1 Tax=Steinernema glaseri TaxID=37863 RepID=A0A1I7ZM72_9BILA